MLRHLAEQIFSYSIIVLMILPFIMMVVDFFVWLYRGRPLSVNPLTKPAKANNTSPKVAR